MPSLYLLDTNAVSDAMADHPKIRARMAGQTGRLVTSVIARGEIRYGLERLPAGKRRTNLKTKADLLFAALPCEPVTEGMADVYGDLRKTVEEFHSSLCS